MAGTSPATPTAPSPSPTRTAARCPRSHSHHRGPTPRDPPRTRARRHAHPADTITSKWSRRAPRPPPRRRLPLAPRPTDVQLGRCESGLGFETVGTRDVQPSSNETCSDSACCSSSSASSRSPPAPMPVGTRAAASSTTTTTSAASAGGSGHARAQYTCGPADGPYITVRVRTQKAMTVMADLVVSGQPAGRSAPRPGRVRGIETSADFTPELTRQVWETGVATVRLQLVDERSEPSRVLTSEPITLRLPAGVGCG